MDRLLSRRGARGSTATTLQAEATKVVEGKTWTFEVVSVRRNLSRDRVNDFGPTADGYHATCQPVMLAILTAFAPQSGDGALFGGANLLGLPEWAKNETYDIDAKVGEADLADWRNPAMEKVMLRSMLQTMLADRFKLTAHREVNEVPVFALVLAKGGPKFKEAVPDEPHPGTAAIPGGGGFMAPGDGGGKVRFIDTTMSSFASIMSNLAGRPVQDRTGLTGRYDLSFQKPTPMGSPSAGQDAGDPGATIFSVMDELGLKLQPTKGETETLVIDHVERPSEN
jgi:uncharacterized protein (TIGR03435 family)